MTPKIDYSRIGYMGFHNHTDIGSNLRLIDSTNKITRLIDRAVKLGHQGIGITDHESLSGHIQALQYVKKQKEKGKIPKDFTLALGNEIYLIEDEKEVVVEKYSNGEKTKFFHFILLAKDKVGHKQLRELSSLAWENNYFTGGMERVPTLKKDLERVINEDKGHLIGTTACLGSEFGQLVMQLVDLEKAHEGVTSPQIKDIKIRIVEFLQWNINLFGRDSFFIELQPARYEEQMEYNRKAIEIAKSMNIGWTIATDSHYLSADEREVHKAYLNSKEAGEGDREVDSFYYYAHMMGVEEIVEHMVDYISMEDLLVGFENTMKIGAMIEQYDLYHSVIVPRINLPKFEVKHIFQKWYGDYEFIDKFAYSDDEQDRYYLHLVEEGFVEKIPFKMFSKEYFFEHLDRINEELKELWLITDEINTKLSSYYITTREIINIMWEQGDSLVGVARGSITGWFTAFLMDLTQLNPIKWNLPHWRHIHHSRPDMADIDLDTQQSRRQQILQALRDYFGARRVLNICTFGTEGGRSAILTACRGLDVDNDEGQFLANLIPSERGSDWSLQDCIYGNKEEGRKPIKELINEMNKAHPNLIEVALGIEGLVNKRSIHASGVYIFQDDFVTQNAMMKSPNGQPTTQFNMNDSDYLGGLKCDLLTIQALDKIRMTMDMLIQDGYMEWQGSLRATYNEYLHPEVLDYESEEMWDMLAENTLIDLFQFDTETGSTSAQRIKPRNLVEMATANSIMRLMGGVGGEQPIDTYIRYKNDISLWYKEMEDFGLTEEEVEVLERHLLIVYGVADTQEIVMEMVMDTGISSFTIVEANMLRKGIAKKDPAKVEEMRILFYEKGLEQGTTQAMLEYVWEIQIKRQLGYSFSKNHTFPYSVIGLQEMNLAYKYPKIYWNCACLSVNAGANEDNEDNKGTDYGKIAQAIGHISSRGVKVALPNINKAKFGFVVDREYDRIVYGLKGVNGIGDEVVHTIIENRPYNSLDDFLTRLVRFPNSPVQNSHVIQLIKAGAFDELEGGTRQEIMAKFLREISEPKSKLNMQNFQMLMDMELIDKEYVKQVWYYMFRKGFMSQTPYKIIENTNPKVKKKIDDKLYQLNMKLTSFFFNEGFDEEIIQDYIGSDVVISSKLFDKEYNKRMEVVKQWIADNEEKLLERVNDILFNEMWVKYASGTLSAWEMDSLCFYYHEHELSHVNADKYSIVNFSELPEEPEPVDWTTRGERKFPKFGIERIMGTVLDRNKNKHTVSLLTTEGVITVKFYSGAFSHYDKQVSRPTSSGKKEIVEKSWFTRGNKLLICGYRRGKRFYPKRYTDTIYQHTVALITDIDEDGNLMLQTEREKV